MRLITEFHNFEKVNQIANNLESVFEFVEIKGETIYASSIVDKRGMPIVRIDSKQPLKALMISVGDKSIKIKSIVNSKGEKGLFDRIMKCLDSFLQPDSLIIVDQDVSGGFWSHQSKKYPQFNWKIEN